MHINSQSPPQGFLLTHAFSPKLFCMLTYIFLCFKKQRWNYPVLLFAEQHSSAKNDSYVRSPPHSFWRSKGRKQLIHKQFCSFLLAALFRMDSSTSYIPFQPSLLQANQHKLAILSILIRPTFKFLCPATWPPVWTRCSWRANEATCSSTGEETEAFGETNPMNSILTWTQRVPSSNWENLWKWSILKA